LRANTPTTRKLIAVRAKESLRNAHAKLHDQRTHRKKRESDAYGLTMNCAVILKFVQHGDALPFLVEMAAPQLHFQVRPCKRWSAIQPLTAA
jgi:hypothetical protein